MKDNPLEGASRFGNKTVWLDQATSDEARDKWFEAYCEIDASAVSQRQQWDIAWAAAVAAHSYIFEGRIGPK